MRQIIKQHAHLKHFYLSKVRPQRALFFMLVTIGQFRYIKIQFDSEAKRTETKEMNKHGHSISFVCVL